MPNPDGAMQWRKSSYSGGGNDCVEVSFGLAEPAVRDSKDPDSGVLRFAPAQWQRLLTAVKAGSLR